MSKNFFLELEKLKNTLPQLKRNYFFEETDSTNTQAVQLAKSGAPEGSLVLADFQTQGRGRLQRQWESPAGKGLYFTLILRPRLHPQQAPLLTLTTGVALLKALETLGLKELLIKWPNDIWVKEKKLAGILCELFTTQVKGVAQIDFILLGVGLNVSQSKEDFSTEIQKLATSVFQVTGEHFSRLQVLECLMKEIFFQIENLIQKGPDFMIEQWKKFSGFMKKNIVFEEAKQTYEATVFDLDRSGHLLVKLKNGEIRTLIAEEVRLKAIEI